MKQYIDKADIIAEIEKLRMDYGHIFNEYDAGFSEGRISAFDEALSFLNTLEVKEINNVWHDARRTIPEDGSEQIICIKEDGLAVSTVGKIVNGTIKWAYLDDLQDTNSFNVEVKEIKEKDLEKEIKLWFDWGLPNNDELVDYIKETARNFFELGLKARKGE